MKDPLAREYGILLGVCGPQMLQRVRDFQDLAEILGKDTPAGRYMSAQAERAKETVLALGVTFNEQH